MKDNNSPNIWIIVLAAITLMTACKSQSKMEEADSNSPSDIRSFSVGFYNVENLFDTKDHPDKEDQQFLPSGDYAWTPDKYTHKLGQLAIAIAKMDTGGRICWGWQKWKMHR